MVDQFFDPLHTRCLDASSHYYSSIFPNERERTSNPIAYMTLNGWGAHEFTLSMDPLSATPLLTLQSPSCAGYRRILSELKKKAVPSLHGL